MSMNPQKIITSAMITASIIIKRLSPNPRFFMISFCSSGIFSFVVFPCVIRPTRFPADVKNAFIIVTLFATSHSAIPILINIRRIVSNLTSSLMSMLSEQKPMTKNRTTRDEPTATNIGSRFAITPQGPPSLKLTGDCPNSSKTSDTLSFQNSTTVCKRSRMTPPKLNMSILHLLSVTPLASLGGNSVGAFQNIHLVHVAPPSRIQVFQVLMKFLPSLLLQLFP